MVATTPVGKKVKIDLIRNGKKKTLTLIPAELAEDKVVSGNTKDEPAEQSHGMTVQNLTSDLAEQLGYDKEADGVVVTAVAPDSPAEEAGIRAGDLIVEVEREKVHSVAEFQKKIHALGANKKPLLLVQNKNGARFVVLEIG